MAMSQSGDNPLVYVDRSSIHGEGLFTAYGLGAGEIIGYYEGPMVKADGMHVLWIEQDDNQWLGYDGRNDMRFLNHSDTPNAEMYGLECYALADIPAGQEITIDYGWNET